LRSLSAGNSRRAKTEGTCDGGAVFGNGAWSSVYLILWLFVIYSFLGVLVEMIFCVFQEGVLESRLGLLYLPLRPLYGVGAVACTLLLHSFINEPILIFLWCILICSVVEYVASFMMERAFGTVTWDYSDKLLNLHGRICLEYSCYWGLLALFVVYMLDRFLWFRGPI
jgi:uncharacterized membrane protein